MEKTDYKKDIDNKDSSKRLMGMRYLNHGLAMAWASIVLEAFGVQIGLPFNIGIKEVIFGTFIVGASLLGVTLLERLRPVK
jgi:hypothetical protein